MEAFNDLIKAAKRHRHVLHSASSGQLQKASESLRDTVNCEVAFWKLYNIVGCSPSKDSKLYSRTHLMLDKRLEHLEKLESAKSRHLAGYYYNEN